MANTSRARRATALTAAAVVAGTVAVTVVQPGVAFSAAQAGRTILSAVSSVPIVTSISPSVGSIDGGTPVVVLGSNFKSLDLDDEDAVTFGGVPAARVAVLSDTKLVAVSPPGAVGAVSVTVTNPTGSTTGKAKFGYRMGLAAEFVSVDAKASGGELLTVAVTGGSLGATSAAFTALKIGAKVGGVVAKVTYVDDEHLKVTIPASAKTGSTTLELVQDGYAGPKSTSTIDYYPVVSGVSPAWVPVEGGEDLKITGAGFLSVDPEDLDSVTFGGVPATYIDVVSGNQINAGVPAGSAGPAAVIVTTPDAASPADGAPRITYQGELAIDDSDEQFLRATGGQHLLTVTGGTIGESAKEFAASGISVRLGATKLPAVWVDSTHVKVTLPALTTESAALTVVNGTVAGDAATLPVVPVVTALSAVSGSVAGGARVTVKVAGTDTAESTDFKFGENDATCAASGAGKSLVFVCTVPPASEAGPVWVQFTSGNGVESRFTSAAAFSYTDID
ncbi:IPT/TIG domain-containing protein [Actinoplanes sp. NBC_00393]|uniref:IPT/TIG domain-containing protein n=1 Tax=Actinoplanes sp. NBC_00393 TaxID=2975953 RepID=UPI002E1DC54C